MGNAGPTYAERDLGEGRCAWVVPLTFGRARIVVGNCNAIVYDDGW